MVFKSVFHYRQPAGINPRSDALFLYIGAIMRHVPCLVTWNRPPNTCLNLWDLQTPLVFCGSHCTLTFYKCILCKHCYRPYGFLSRLCFPYDAQLHESFIPGNIRGEAGKTVGSTAETFKPRRCVLGRSLIYFTSTNVASSSHIINSFSADVFSPSACRVSITKPESPLTATQEISCSLVSGSRQLKVLTKERTKTKRRDPSPACGSIPYPKEFDLLLWGGQQPQGCKEFNRLFNLQTALYQTWSNPIAPSCSL
jgi:hypothetical protein